jgi:hypothetical protein
MATPFPSLDGSAPKQQQFQSAPEHGLDGLLFMVDHDPSSRPTIGKEALIHVKVFPRHLHFHQEIEIPELAAANQEV